MSNNWQEEIFFKKLSCFEGTFCILLVGYSALKGLIWKETAEIHFRRTYKNEKVFCTKDGTEGSPKLVFLKILLLKYLLLLLLLQASMTLYQLKFLMKNCIISLVVNNFAVVKMRPDKALYMVSSADLGRMLWSLCRSPIALLILFNIILKCSLNDRQLSRMSNCFCELASYTMSEADLGLL